MNIRKRNLTQDEFDKARPLFGRMSQETIEMARLVLVEGFSQTQVAKEFKLTRQRVSLAVKQILTAIDDVPADWVKLDVWLPSSMANEVIKKIDEVKKNQKNKES